MILVGHSSSVGRSVQRVEVMSASIQSWLILLSLRKVTSFTGHKGLLWSIVRWTQLWSDIIVDTWVVSNTWSDGRVRTRSRVLPLICVGSVICWWRFKSSTMVRNLFAVVSATSFTWKLKSPIWIWKSESESNVAGAHCVLSRHGERFAWVVKRENLFRLLQSSLKGCEGRRQFYIRW